MSIDEQIQSRVILHIKKGENVLSTHRPNAPGVIGFPTLGSREYANWQAQSLAFLNDLLGPENTYTRKFEESTSKSGFGYSGSASRGIGILQAVKEDIEQGFISTVRQLLTAEVFSNFFEQAEHLLKADYKEAAASLAAAVLENGLRSIAIDNAIQIKTTDNLSSLNQKLADKAVYNRLMQKKVSVWISVRNSADHGEFDSFDKNDVSDLIEGAQSLLASLM